MERSYLIRPIFLGTLRDPARITSRDESYLTKMFCRWNTTLKAVLNVLNIQGFESTVSCVDPLRFLRTKFVFKRSGVYLTRLATIAA